MRALFFIAALLTSLAMKAQNTETDSLKRLLAVTQEDAKRVTILEGLSYAYVNSYPDTAMQYALNGLQLARSINYRKGEAICINALGNVYFHIGDNAKALEFYLDYLKIKEELKDWNNISVAYFNIAGVYVEEQDYNHALFYLFKAMKEDEKAKDSSAILFDAYSLGSTYLRMQKTDSALFYINQSHRLAKTLNDENMMGAILNTYGETYLATNDTARASQYYHLSIPYAEHVEDNEVLTSNYYGLAKIFRQKQNYDSAIVYARRALHIARAAPFFKQVLEVSSFLTDLFKDKKQFDSAFFYQQLSLSTKDSLFNAVEVKKVQDLKFSEQQRQQAIETAKIKFQNQVRLYAVIFTALVFLMIAVLLWRNNKQKQKANALLQQQKDKVEATLAELKSAQEQLIQSEKMASLGELTAGIAHEIQNPLNFVNNFSELNKEMIEELKDEIDRGNYNEVKMIADDIAANAEKINHHGKRADGIVKGMLQHSRKSTGQKELTNINTLCDEYLRLAYHGLRAKDKTFNAKFETDFDPTIGTINVVPQEIGRVILNLINNAFYSMNEKKKEGDTTYQPTLNISTKKEVGEILIIIKDNGTGIPQKVIGKVFQPFFTTKPPGSGTGLGLSLSYDIIKAHGGDIKVKTNEGEGTIFLINLPL